MSIIDSKEAEDKYQITALHEKMPSGELRFRLKKGDGTAYIRTEASPEGSWQNSHYHHVIRETYIVQEGWIAYAELIDGKIKLSKYGPDDLFTTKPGIIHNIYMPAGAVIHTIKHGQSSGDDRTADEHTQLFDGMTKVLQEEEINLIANKENSGHDDKKNRTVYSEEYCHYDKLIWLLPQWSTAIFLGTIATFPGIASASLQPLTSLKPAHLAVGFLSLMFFFLLALNHAVYRFRVHQAPMKGYKRTPIWTSASTILQLTVTMQAFTLFFLILIFSGLNLFWSLGINIVLIALLTAHREYSIRYKHLIKSKENSSK